jgi:hypothetical protein
LAGTDGAGITFYVTKLTFSIPFATHAQWFVPHADLIVCVCMYVYMYVCVCLSRIVLFLFLRVARRYKHEDSTSLNVCIYKEKVFVVYICIRKRIRPWSALILHKCFVL